MHESISTVCDSAEKVNVTPLELSRFWAKVDKTTSPHGCWLWTASASHGYGNFRLNQRTTGAHIVSWIIHKGYRPILFVCHNCPGGDNSLCVNPDHLWEGTQAENNKDCVAKGRHNVPSGDGHYSRLHPEKMARGDRSGARTHPEKLKRGDEHHFRLRPETAPIGERNGASIITAEDVRDIRARVQPGMKSKQELSKEYNICVGAIYRICSRKSWAHVE